MIKSKKQLLIIFSSFILIVLLGTISYAIFNYSKSGAQNSLATGRIHFNADQGNDTLSLTNVYPMTSTKAASANLDTLSIHITGDTTYSGGEEYQLTFVDVVNTVNTGLVNEKTVPVNYIATYTATQNKTVGSAPVSDYYTERGLTTTLYDLTATGEIGEGKELLKGYIASGATGIDGTLTIKAYIDSSKVAVTNTYDGTESESMGTTTEWVDDRLVLTTTEWNSLRGVNAISFKIKAEANEGVWILGPYANPNTYAANIKCQRVTDATKLHTETCTNSNTSSYCQGDGYALNAEITYGNAKLIKGDISKLTVGDAFDCDVDGDGIIDKDENGNSTERFYYVSKLWKPAVETIVTPDLSDTNFDNNYAVLIYYKNFKNGSPDDGGAAYATKDDVQAIDGNATNYDNWHGPVTAVKHLPTTSTWSNVSLSNTSRTIYACDNVDCSNTPVLTTNSGNNTITNPFSYTGKAARILTLPELVKGCQSVNNNTSLDTHGSLTACNFLLEGTKYADSSKETNVQWLETPRASSSYYVWYACASDRSVYNSNANGTTRGVRPTIDVPYSQILY